eukprot:s66_g10.t1
MNAMELNAISHVAQLRLEQAKLQNYARTLEDEARVLDVRPSVRQAQHQVEAAAAAEQAEQLRVRLLSAEATASNVVAQVEAEAARRAQANQADAEAALLLQRADSSLYVLYMRAQTQGMELLQKNNAELRHRLAEAEAHPASRQEGEPEADPGPARAPGGDAVAPDGDAKDKDEKRKKGVEVLKAEAKSLHHMMSHQPKNPFCDVCQRAKMYKPPSYASGGIRTIEAKDFGDHITADHIMIYRDKDTVIEDSRLALVIKDVATGFCYAYPSALKSADECTSALQHFTSSKDVIKNFYSDRAPELSAAAKILKWRHEKSKAYLHQTNAIAERQVRSVTSVLLHFNISHPLRM